MSVFLYYTIAGQDITVLDKLISFSYRSSIDSQAETSTLKLIDTTYDKIENILNEQGADVVFRYGYETQLSNTKKAFVTKHYPVYEANGAKLYIETTDPTALMNRGSKNKGYYGKVSGIVQQIAENHNLKTEIEETDFSQLLINAYATDIAFIRDILRPRAIAARTGRGDYDVYMSEGKVLHFHPPDFTQNARGVYTFSQADRSKLRGTVLQYIPFCNAEDSVREGGINYTISGYDYRQKTSLRHIASNSNSSGKVVVARKVRADSTNLPKSYTINRYSNTAFDSQKLVNNAARTRYSHADRIRYSAYVRLVGDPTILAGDIINIVMPKPDGNVGLHHSSSFYLVHTVEHTIFLDQGAIKYNTEVFLIRSGSLLGKERLAGKIKNSSNTNIQTHGQIITKRAVRL